MKIGKKNLSDDYVYIIAEIGNNHNGDMNAAKQLIDIAADAGADCVKFQMRKLDRVYRQKSLNRDGEDLGVEYVLDLLDKYELSIEQHMSLFRYTKAKQLEYMCTPWDTASADVLSHFPVSAFKVASADFTNLYLLEHLLSFNKPLILSTGMTSEEEIKTVVKWLNSKAANFTLLHCNSTYPAPFSDINLCYIERLKKFHPSVGYSGHERGVGVSIGAVALGAVVIERHITLDKNLEGPDHQASLEPDEFTLLVKSIRELKSSMNNKNVSRKISQGELINRENLGKSLVAACDIAVGTKITRQHIEVKSPGQGLPPIHLEKLLGKSAVRQLKAEDYFFISDVNEIVTNVESFDFKMRWGIPVRFHDLDQFNALISPDLWEFHLSYSDLEIDWKTRLSEKKYPSDIVVHAPELFFGSHLLDLASTDQEYLQTSIKNLKNVVRLTKDLRNSFACEGKTLLVANVGGFTTHEFLTDDLKNCKYEILAKSLELFKDDEVEIIPQTMAPFPWHFGGQRYQNLLMLPDDTVQFLEKTKHRICLDVSHSWLTCNQFSINFENLMQLLGPHAAHLHIADASGTNGEGLQFGDGEMDIKQLTKLLNRFCKQSSFIPEIWQGHKNFGEGFWNCLKLLSGKI